MKNRKNWALSLVTATALLSSPLTSTAAALNDTVPSDPPEPALAEPLAPDSDTEAMAAANTPEAQNQATDSVAVSTEDFMPQSTPTEGNDEVHDETESTVANAALTVESGTTNLDDPDNLSDTDNLGEDANVHADVNTVEADDAASDDLINRNSDGEDGEMTENTDVQLDPDNSGEASTSDELSPDAENAAQDATNATDAVGAETPAQDAAATAGATDPVTDTTTAQEPATPEITSEEAADIEEMVGEWLDVRTNAAATDVSIPSTYDEVYERMAALEAEYPEGREWTNFTPYGKDGPLADTYWWKGGKIKGASGGVGCAAFAFILSDHAFGDLPARTLDNGTFSYDDVKVGDILRVNDSHFVIVTRKSAGGVTVAEGNYNKSVHWGRAMSVDEVMAANFIVTRYPENFVSADAEDADSVVQSGKENLLDWSLTKSGVLTVSGSGALPDYSPNDSLMPSWHSFNNSITSIILQNGITGVGNYTFYQSKALSAYLADSILRIGQSAFRGSNLVSITIPQSTKAIENDAFRDCKNLTSATIPEGVETIGERAFQGDTSLKYIDFPSTATSVGSGAFTSCDSLVRIRFAPGTEKAVLGNNLFTQCWHLQSVTLPQGLVAISPGMFSSCKSLFALYIPKSVKSLTVSGEESPFMSSGLRLIEFGGSEAEWEAMLKANPYLRSTLQGVQVQYNVEFDDPFAPIPGDPGDIKFDETQPDNPDNPDQPTDPDNPDDPNNPGGDTDPDDPDDPNHPGGNTDPDDPSQPDNPDHPSDPGQPDQPGVDNPDRPSQPSKPNRPSRPSRPQQPSGSNVSDHSPADNSSDSPSSVIGPSISSETLADGTVITTTTSADGVQALEVELASTSVAGAERSHEPVVLAIPSIKPATDPHSAPTLTIWTNSKAPISVAIPVANPTTSTVLTLVQTDGTVHIIANSILRDDHLFAALPDGAKVQVLDNHKIFTDVALGSPFETAIDFVTARELLKGTTDTTFAPDAPMTQQALLTALARLSNISEIDAADWAREHFLTNDDQLQANLTLEQLINVLWQYYQNALPDHVSNEVADTQPVEQANQFMVWVISNNLITENSELSASFENEITRAEAAVILQNFITNISL